MKKKRKKKSDGEGVSAEAQQRTSIEKITDSNS